MNDLSKELLQLTEKRVPSMGKFILKKQCEDMGIDFENISKEDIEELAEKMANAVEMFLGYEESHKIRNLIMKKKFE